MSTYRPSYDDRPRLYHDLPPPPPPSDFLPPLPHGPPPSYDAHHRNGGDSWRPSDISERRNGFTFRNDDAAPQYPRDQDYLRPTRSVQYAMQENSRRRPRNQHQDRMNLNHARRGQYFHFGRFNRNVPSERPLLRHQDAGKDMNEQLLGMTVGQAGASKFMPAEDVSDSDEEQMDESDSDMAQSDASNADLANGQEGEERLEPSAKRRALMPRYRNAHDGASEPKWSNPDPYTVLPPIDDSQRKRKDVVKLIRKARKEAEVTAAERNQVAANDDFISFGMDNETPEMAEEIRSNPDVDGLERDGAGMPGAPTGPRQFSHLSNLYSSNVPGVPGPYISAQSLGPPPDLPQFSTAGASRVLPDTALPVVGNPSKDGVMIVNRTEDTALGSRKRTHDDIIKETPARLDKPARKGRKETPLGGAVLAEWIANEGSDSTPWLRKEDHFTANAGFRLHKEICDFYNFVKPQDFEQTVREELLSRLQDVISKQIPHCRVHCFGSFAAGLYLPTADMDVVIISENYRIKGRKVICQTKSQMHSLGRFLEDSKLAQPGSVEVILGAKVPIIKFIDRVTAIKIDVSFENNTGIVANDTFAAWKREFPAMPVLVTVIKQFLMMRGLNEVMYGGLGGFSVTCLVTSLLQNMPRVQTGELIPEEHLGEMLIEFLDFYGNRLDTTRTGLMMDPPGYFDKQAYRRPTFRGAVYQPNKADRLAIIDPNNPDNDISGGSKEVMCIFDQFSEAHNAILTAIKESNRPSLLNWLLGGNYESFGWQRNHLLNLYNDRWTPSADIRDQDRLLERTEGKLQGSNESSTDPRTALAANMQNVEAIPNPNGPRPKATKTPKQASHGHKARALSLRQKYPDMKDIPTEVSKKQKKKLIERHEQKKRAMVLSREPWGETSGANQSTKLKTHEATEGKTKRSAQVNANLSTSSGTAPTNLNESNITSISAANQAPRPAPKVHKQATRRARKKQHGTSQNLNVVNQPSNKMAPLSDARRAEVVHNLKGLTHNDPINVD